MKPTLEKFQKDVTTHKLEVLLDQGLYRHLKVYNPTLGGIMAYNVVTTPDYLFYYGDMGSYSFSRVEDMFTFFRPREDNKTYINPDYWYKKLESVDRSDGAKEFNKETFIDNVKSHMIDCEWPKDVQEDVIDFVESMDYYCDTSVSDLINKEFGDNGEYTFDDFYEYDNYEYTQRFIWCLRAIVHAINLYDEHKEQSEKLENYKYLSYIQDIFTN